MEIYNISHVTMEKSTGLSSARIIVLNDVATIPAHAAKIKKNML